MNKTLARKIAAGVALALISTFAVLLARNYNWRPERQPPDYRVKGPKNSEIQIVEFSNFSCSACARANSILKDVEKVYGKKILLKFKHFPFHGWSLSASLRAECAGLQGKFFEYADLLFERQNEWVRSKKEPVGKFADYAGEIGLDTDVFSACARENGQALKNIMLDKSEAEMRNVDATPTFFVNGERAVGTRQLINLLKKLRVVE